jgi:hypothetical protein
MLIPALRAHDMVWWSDRNIGAGEDWERRICREIQLASFALLLITDDYLSSDFIYKRELLMIEGRGIPVTWVLVDDCLWDDCDRLTKWQAARDPRVGPISVAANVNSAIAEACRSIRDDFCRQQHSR